MKSLQLGSMFFATGLACSALVAQSVPAAAKAPAAAAASATPAPAAVATRTFHDPAYKISFDVPADWKFTRRDGEISTFRLDARSAARTTVLRAVVGMPENPFPESTFSGAYLYFSVTPHLNDAACARQAAASSGSRPVQGSRGGESEIAGISFAHGHDEQTAICTVERDEIYTTLRRGTCYRIDLAINTFCGGEVSGVKDITGQQLDAVRGRLEAILGTVRFDAK